MWGWTQVVDNPEGADTDNESPLNHLLGSSITYRIATGTTVLWTNMGTFLMWNQQKTFRRTGGYSTCARNNQQINSCSSAISSSIEGITHHC